MNQELKGGRGECKYCGNIFNNVSLHEEMECEKARMPWIKTSSGHWIQGAPEWLRHRMMKLRELPKPTVEEVVAQWKASEEQLRYIEVKDIREATVLK